MYGFGNCIHAAYTYGADGSAATAGSHPLPMAGEEMIRSPVHPAFAATAADDPVMAMHAAKNSASNSQSEPPRCISASPSLEVRRSLHRGCTRVHITATPSW